MKKLYSAPLFWLAVVLFFSVGAIVVRAQDREPRQGEVTMPLSQYDELSEAQTTNPNDSELGFSTSFYPKSTNCGYTATTSPTYFTADTTASSTCSFLVDNLQSVSLNWTVVGSSTSAVLQYELYESNDDTVAGRTWYDIRTFSNADGLVTYGSSPALHKVSISNATSAPSTLVEDLNSKYIEVRYAVTGANAAVTLQIAGNE